ncbi:MAG: hypothetical protein WD029_09130 [Microthrixaceae bacterium]
MRKKPQNPASELPDIELPDIELPESELPAGRLYLEFCGEDYTLRPEESLSFGRSADLILDDNPYMHRVLGRFVHRGQHWCVQNLATNINFTVKDANGAGLALIAPNSTAAVLHGEFTCGFVVGPTTYELSGALEDFELVADLLGKEGANGTRTMDWGRVELNEDQNLLLLAMCERRLLNPQTEHRHPPTNRQSAQRLGWSLTKFNRKLDHLCEKLQRAGIANVHGGLGANAMDRRLHLMEHALQVQLITVADLHLIDRQRAAA